MIAQDKEWIESAVTRRQFVKATAAVAAGAIAGRAMPQTASPVVQRHGVQPLKVGLIGCGGRGSGAALQALAADKNVVLYAMADAFADRIEQSLRSIKNELASRAAATQPASTTSPDQVQVEPDRCFSGFDAYEKVIELCDVVLLAEPPHFRPAHVRAAVSAGRDVFCEKPVAVDASGVRLVLESAAIAQQKNLSLVSGFCWRYSARERDTFAQIHSGALGDIRALYTTYNAGGWVGPKPRQAEWSEMEFQMRNWHYFTWLSGDHIVEQACHAIDWMAWAMNGRLPARCTAVGGRAVRDAIGEPGNAFDHFGVTFDYDHGPRAFHMCRHFPNSPFDNSMTVYGTKGTCSMASWADRHVIEGEQPWKCQTTKNDMYQQEHDELFASIRNGKPINDGVWMAHSTLMAVMARMAAYSGQAITWEQALNSQEELKPASYGWAEAPPICKVAVPGITKFS
jgi:predicted dehydrogenase